MNFKPSILLLVSLFILFSCDSGIKFDNPLDERNRTSDSNNTEAETESDSDKTDTMSEYDDEKTDTVSTNDEENQNRDDSDSGDTMPDDADSTDDSGDSVPDENKSDNDSADSVSDDDSDSVPENDDDTDSEPDEDEDEPVVVSTTTKCSDIPENAVYNTVDEITQTWNGEEWIPTNESYFSETSSTTECRFKCKSSYIWTGSQCALPTTPCDSNPCSGLANSNGSCTIAGSNYVCGCNTHYTWTGSVCKAEEQVKNCTGKPENASWNTASQIKQTWDGEEWYPSTTAVYNTNASTTECRFKCNTNYSWNSSNSTCVLTTQQGTCSAKPENTVWNDGGKNGKFDQTWNGLTYTPESYTSTYNETAGVCRFKCNTNYSWNSANSTCVLTTQQGNCSAKPANTVWNDNGKNGKFDQTWNGATYTPESYTSTYNESAGICRFKCVSAEYTWNGTTCAKGGSSTLPECSSTSSTPCKDSSSGLTWSKKSGSTMTYSAATSYCSGSDMSGYGGYSDWRLPNISELRTLIKNCSGTQMPGGSCGVREDEELVCLSRSCHGEDCYACSSDSTGGYSKFGDTAWFWSSSTPSGITDYAWRVYFMKGGVSLSYKSSSSYVRCVRNAE